MTVFCQISIGFPDNNPILFFFLLFFRLHFYVFNLKEFLHDVMKKMISTKKQDINWNISWKISLYDNIYPRINVQHLIIYSIDWKIHRICRTGHCTTIQHGGTCGDFGKYIKLAKHLFDSQLLHICHPINYILLFCRVLIF